MGLPVSKRLEQWERYNARALVGLACRTINGDPLEATERNVWLPNVEIAHVTGTPHVVERTLDQIDRHPANAVVLYVAMAGEAFFYYEDGVRILRPGQAVLCDADAPFVRGFARGLAELVLKVPRPVFDGISDGTALRVPRVFDITGAPSANIPGYTLAKLLGSALRSGPDEDPQCFEADVLGMFRTLIAGVRTGDSRSQLHAAMSFVERHLVDRSLSAARIAAGIGISERQLSRLFSEHGGVARWITDKRLDLARGMLTANPATPVSIGEVAGECGFSSQTYFARAFKQRFSETPLETRRRAAGRSTKGTPGRGR